MIDHILAPHIAPGSIFFRVVFYNTIGRDFQGKTWKIKPLCPICVVGEIRIKLPEPFQAGGVKKLCVCYEIAELAVE